MESRDGSPSGADDEPLIEHSQGALGKVVQKYTPTGQLWIYAPWLLIVRKRLRCSLLELLIVIVALGSSEGSLVSALIHHKAPPVMIAIVSFLILYGFLWSIAAALYNKRLKSSLAADLPNGVYVAMYMFVPALGCHAIGWLLWQKL